MGDTLHKGIGYRENLGEQRRSMVSCDICTDLVSLPNKFFKNQNKCAHPICVDCMIKYINAKQDSRISRIKCPALNCGYYLDPLSCRPIIPKLVLDRWCDVLCESAILKFDRCYCPYRECSVLILNECGGSTKKSECPKCKKLFCFSCQVAWHQGYSCEEIKNPRDWHDVSSRVLSENKNWKRCPACNHCVELISGCSIVKCRCGTSFCYVCGRKTKTYCCDDSMTHPFSIVVSVIFTGIVILAVYMVFRFCILAS